MCEKREPFSTGRMGAAQEVTEADIEDGVESDENANSILLQLALLVVVFGAIALFLLPSFLYIGLGPLAPSFVFYPGFSAKLCFLSKD